MLRGKMRHVRQGSLRASRNERSDFVSFFLLFNDEQLVVNTDCLYNLFFILDKLHGKLCARLQIPWLGILNFISLISIILRQLFLSIDRISESDTAGNLNDNVRLGVINTTLIFNVINLRYSFIMVIAHELHETDTGMESFIPSRCSIISVRELFPR